MRNKQLLKRICDDPLQNIIFTSEKLFTVKQTFSQQNDRLPSIGGHLVATTS